MALLISFSISLYRSAALLISWDISVSDGRDGSMVARDQPILLFINLAYMLRLVFYVLHHDLQ